MCWCPYIENSRQTGDFRPHRQANVLNSHYHSSLSRETEDCDIPSMPTPYPVMQDVNITEGVTRLIKKPQSPQGTRPRRNNSASNERTIKTGFLYTYYDLPEVLRNRANPR